MPISELNTQQAALPVQRPLMLILSTVLFTFVGYFCIGLPMAVLPGFVDRDLALGPVVAGLTVGVQYVSTIVSRPYAGRLSDTLGAKTTVLWGMVTCFVSGLFLLAAGWLVSWPLASLTVLAIGRLFLGVGESCAGTGAIAWAAGRLGGDEVSRIMSWNGIATYGALALAAPLGVWLSTMGSNHWSIAPLGWATLAVSAPAILLAAVKQAAPIVQGVRASLFRLVWGMLPFGAALALGSFGFGTIMTYVALFFAEEGWGFAALAITAYSCGFVGSRLMFAASIPKWGSLRVALLSLIFETMGLLILASAPGEVAAIAGAGLAGLGLSLVFPSLGVEAVALFAPHDRGAAVGVYTLFLDVALAMAGPLGGLAASSGDYRLIYYGSAGAAVLAALIVVNEARRRGSLSARSTRG